MDLQSICRDVMDDVDGSLGCVLTDLETGLPLAAEYRAGTVMDANMATLVSYVGIDLFRGKLVRNFERSLSRDHARPNGFVREVQLTTSNSYQFMSTVPGWDRVIFILVTNRNVSLGMGLLAVHDAVRRLGDMPARAVEPSDDRAFRARDEVSEPSPPPPAQPWQARRPEPEYDGTSGTPRSTRREPREERMEEPPSRVPSLSETRPTRRVPEVSQREPEPPPAEPTEPAVEELPEAAAAPVEEPPAQRVPPAVPVGPRARMFFKRSGDENNSSRRRR
ncbi:MAG: hypothetical protein OXP28_11240 [Gammaproteobacteria bacterium]|nr:hypothetical protein [Gammaproteobacteria bacterium]MDE0225700.1 hypothetical protein [Gammaproteobacteria bacterium]MDE0452252.1 hypothetical protein [Gammaproteobacteria bacterium]